MDAHRRVELLNDLRVAKEESAHLSETILVVGHGLDNARLLQLRIELRVAQHRTARLTEELACSERSGSAAA